MIKEKVTSPVNDMDKSYVYDLYYINQPHFNYTWLENIPYVDIYRQDENYINDQYSDPEDIYEDDDDDSNDENNWRNDYPDEDPHFYDPVEKNDEDDDDDDVNHYFKGMAQWLMNWLLLNEVGRMRLNDWVNFF